MFGLLFLLISGALAQSVTINLNNTITGDCAEATASQGDWQCGTVAKAVAKGDSLTPKITEFSVGASANAFSGAAFTAELAATGFKITGDSNTAATLDLSVKALTIGSSSAEASLEVSNLVVTVSKAAAQFADVVKGALTLNTVTFAPTTGSGAFTGSITQSLLQVASGTVLTIGGTSSFSNIKGSVNGPCINIELAAGAKMSVTATFADCTSESTAADEYVYGGAVYMSMAGVPSDKVREWTFAPTVTYTPVTPVSSRSNAGNEAKGKFLYVKSTADVFNASYWSTAVSDTTVKAAGNALLEYDGIVVDLLSASKIYIDSTSTVTGGSGCGAEATPCKSFADAIANAADKALTGFILKANKPSDAATTFTANTYINGAGKTWEIPQTVNTLLSTGSNTLTLNNIQFSFTTTDTSATTKETPAVLASIGGTLTMHKCKVSLGASDWVLTNEPINVGSANLNLYGCEFNGLKLKNKPLFKASNLDKIKMYKSGTLVNKITGIERTGGNGAVFELTSVGTITLNNVEISGTKVTASTPATTPADGLGSILYVKDTSTAACTFEATNTAITSGEASSGKAFYFDVKDDKVLKYMHFIEFLAENPKVAEADIMYVDNSETTPSAKAISTLKKTIKVQVNTSAITDMTHCGGDYKASADAATVPACPTLADAKASYQYTDYLATAMTISGDLAGVESTVTIDHYMEITGSGNIPNYGSSEVLKFTGSYASITGLSFTYDKKATSATSNAEDVRGAMLSVAQDAKLVLNNVKFTIASGQTEIILNSMVIAGANEANITLNGCTFEGISLKEQIVIIPNSKKEMFNMKGENKFINIAGKGLCEGAAMGGVVTAATDDLVISGATFESCSAAGLGGALFLGATGGTLTLSKLTFNACSATKAEGDNAWQTGFGGAICMYADGTPTFKFSELSFTGCTAAGAGSILAVVPEDDKWMGNNYNKFAEFIKLGRTSNLAVNCTADTEKKTVSSADIYKLVPETVSVDKINGEDSDTCGIANEEKKTKACKTFGKSLAAYYGLPTKIQLTNEAFEEETAQVWTLAQTMSITGTAGESATSKTSIKLSNCPAETVKGNGIFIIGNEVNTLTVSFGDLTFNINTDVDDGDRTFFYVTKAATLELNNVGLVNASKTKFEAVQPIIYTTEGKLSLTGVNFDKFYILMTPIVMVQSVNSFVTFTGCNFNDITRAYGFGAALTLMIQDGDKFNLAENNFTNCKVLNGSGGAVAIMYNKGNLTIGNQEFNQTKKNCTTVFKGCSAASLVKNDTNDTNADETPMGVGGAIFLYLQDVDPEKYLLNITSILIEDCTADKGGNGMYAQAVTEEGTKLLENKDFWGVLTKINGNKKGEFTILDDKGQEEKPKGSSGGFPVWAIIVIVVVAVVIVVVVVVIIICCCCRSSS